MFNHLQPTYDTFPAPPKSLFLTPDEPQSLFTRLSASFRRYPHLFGYAIMLISALAHASMTFMVHIGSLHYSFPVVSTLLVRSIVEGSLTILHNVCFLRPAIHIRPIPLRRWAILLLRGAFAATSISFQVFALTLLPMGNAVTLLFTCPSITMALAALFLAEPVRPLDYFSLIFSFAGVIMVARPSFLHFTPADHGTSATSIAIALSAAFFTSAASVTTRYIGHSVHYMFNVTSLSICLFILSFLLSTPNDLEHITSNMPGLFINIAAGACGFISQATMAKSLQNCRAGPALLVRSLTIPFSFILGLVFLSEKAAAITLCGVTLIVGAAFMLAMRELYNDESKDNMQPPTLCSSNVEQPPHSVAVDIDDLKPIFEERLLVEEQSATSLKACPTVQQA